MRLGWELNHQPCDHGRRNSGVPNRDAVLTNSIPIHIISVEFTAWQIHPACYEDVGPESTRKLL